MAPDRTCTTLARIRNRRTARSNALGCIADGHADAGEVFFSSMQVPDYCPVCRDTTLKPVRPRKVAGTSHAAADEILAYRCSRGHTFTTRQSDRDKQERDSNSEGIG